MADDKSDDTPPAVKGLIATIKRHEAEDAARANLERRQRLGEWAKSPEGEAAMADAVARAREDGQRMLDMDKIDPEVEKAVFGPPDLFGTENH